MKNLPDMSIRQWNTECERLRDENAALVQRITQAEAECQRLEMLLNNRTYPLTFRLNNFIHDEQGYAVLLRVDRDQWDAYKAGEVRDRPELYQAEGQS